MATKEQKEINKAFETKDIDSLAWVLLRHCFEDIKRGDEPRYGQTLFKTVMERLLIKSKSPESDPITNDEVEDLIITEWLNIQ